MLLVDTCVLVDVLQRDPVWAAWSIAQLRAQAHLHSLGINPVIYAELSLAFSTVEALDEVLATLQIPMVELPKPALFLAGRAAPKPMCCPASSLAPMQQWPVCRC